MNALEILQRWHQLNQLATTDPGSFQQQLSYLGQLAAAPAFPPTSSAAQSALGDAAAQYWQAYMAQLAMLPQPEREGQPARPEAVPGSAPLADQSQSAALAGLIGLPPAVLAALQGPAAGLSLGPVSGQKAAEAAAKTAAGGGSSRAVKRRERVTNGGTPDLNRAPTRAQSPPEAGTCSDASKEEHDRGRMKGGFSHLRTVDDGMDDGGSPGNSGDEGCKQGMQVASGGVVKCSKEKNRQAQRRFRERQKALIINLRESVKTLGRESDEQAKQIYALQEENRLLKMLLQDKQAKVAKEEESG